MNFLPIQGVGNTQPPERKKESATKVEKIQTASQEEAKQEKVANRHQAEQVAISLERISDPSLKFVVRDPTTVGPNNVIIQVLNEKQEVIATIPSEAVLRMAKAMEEANRQAVEEVAKGAIQSFFS